MFNSLRGPITGQRYPLVMLSTGGVEWQIEVSAATFRALIAEGEEGDERRVWTWLQVQETGMRLFGFADLAEREAFEQLLKVPGIGARQAIRVLSGTTVPMLTRMLAEDDVDALSSIPGIGRKTAQKIILQLKGTLAAESTPQAAGLQPTGPHGDLVTALVEMGYDRARAQRAVDGAVADLDTAGEPTDEHRLFREAIVALSGS